MIGGSEVFLIILAILVLFGAKQLPELARGLGKGVAELKKATDDIKKDVDSSMDSASGGLSDTLKNVKKDFDEIKSNITSNLKV